MDIHNTHNYVLMKWFIRFIKYFDTGNGIAHRSVGPYCIKYWYQSSSKAAFDICKHTKPIKTRQTHEQKYIAFEQR